MSGDLSELTRSSELLHVLARLRRSGFTGVVYAEHEPDSLVVSIRNGHPVFVEDLGETSSIPDMLLEQGLVSKEQYADIASRVLESLSESEDVAFCEQVIAAGILTTAQVEAAIDKRIRGRLIQAVSWEECRIDIDGDPDALAGIMELPQDLGSIIYVGVRTFFDDERVRAALGDEPRYVRLLRPPAEIETFFDLEGEDSALLGQLQPDRNVADVIEQSAADTLEAYQLLCMLRLADMAELANAPFPPANERSGVRSTEAQPAAQPAAAREPQRPRSTAHMPAARPEIVRSASQARMPIPREDGPRPGSQNRVPIPREEGGRRGGETRVPGVREERVVMPGSRQRIPAVVEAGSAPNRLPSPSPAEAAPSRPAEPARAPAAPHQRPLSPQPEARAAMPAPRAAPGQPAQRALSGPIAPPAQRPDPQPAAAPANPLTERKRPRRKLSQALQRLDRELKQMRPQSTPEEHGEEAAPSHGRAHLEHLMRMRQANASQRSQVASAAVAPLQDDPFQKAQEALRDQQFGRAYELMRKACDSQPDNEVYAMYQLWAGLRSNNIKEDGVTKLRALLRARVSDDEHKKFAYYALGHLSLFERKDDAAEKFFRKAIELDKNNKDAERHLRIIELRRKTATEQKNNKIFGIEIGKKS